MEYLSVKLKFDLVFHKTNRENPVQKCVSCAKQLLKRQIMAKRACHTVGCYGGKLNKTIFLRVINPSYGIKYSEIDLATQN